MPRKLTLAMHQGIASAERGRATRRTVRELRRRTPASHQKPFSRAVAALGKLRVRGLATYGALDPPGDPAPANVTVTQWAAHAAVLPQAAAVVCHGGHGTVMKALAHGAPLVVLPLGRDQKDTRPGSTRAGPVSDCPRVPAPRG